MESIQTQSPGEITLYTNHGCPWAHRAHVVLKELGLEYKEVIIDLDRPRDEWYLKINPRGLVPAIQHTHPSFSSAEPATVIESGLVVQYLIDAFPELSGHILPAGNDPKSAIARYQTNLLLETWSSKVASASFKAQLNMGTDEAPELNNQLFEAIKTHIEPQLANALVKGQGPFVGGSDRFTLFEILTAPFVLRTYDFSNDIIHPKSLAEKLDILPAFSSWAKHVRAQDSVTYIWKKDDMVERIQRRIPEMRKKYGVSK